MYVRVTNGQPEIYTIGQLRRDNPNTSFPKNISDEILASYDVFRLSFVERPSVDHTKNITEGTPALVDGVWTQVWNVSDASSAEIEQRTTEQAASARSQRNDLLKQSDWVVIYHTEKGSNVPLEWELYRQNLRDLTAHPNWPHLSLSDWPQVPA